MEQVGVLQCPAAHKRSIVAGGSTSCIKARHAEAGQGNRWASLQCPADASSAVTLLPWNMTLPTIPHLTSNRTYAATFCCLSFNYHAEVFTILQRQASLLVPRPGLLYRNFPALFLVEQGEHLQTGSVEMLLPWHIALPYNSTSNHT